VKRYAEVLRVPHVALLIGATLLARFPIGINALALILYLREQTGSFAVAGVVAGGLAAGAGVGAPVQGRLVDRLGQRRVLVPLAFVHAAALGSIVAFAELGAPAPVLLACSVSAGFAIPPTSSVLRSMWPGLLRERPELVAAAYALDSVLIELIFVLGPLLTAVIAALMSPAAALIVSAASVIFGTIAFTAQAPSRAIRPDPEATAAAGRFGALASPGVRSLVLTSLPAGIGIGICEVTLPAFSRASGSAELAGVLLAVWSLGSAAGGLAFGAWQRRPPLQRVHIAVAAALPLALLPLAAAPSVAVMALLVIPAGMFVAPLLATRNELIGWVAPAGSRTEAYTWPVTAFVGGIAIGSAVGGGIVEVSSWRLAFLVGAGAAAIGAVLAVARRGTLVPPAGRARGAARCAGRVALEHGVVALVDAGEGGVVARAVGDDQLLVVGVASQVKHGRGSGRGSSLPRRRGS
jgi:MFS family permease